MYSLTDGLVVVSSDLTSFFPYCVSFSNNERVSKVDVVRDLFNRKGSEKPFKNSDGGQDHRNSQFKDLFKYISPTELNRPVRGNLHELDVTVQRLRNVTLRYNISNFPYCIPSLIFELKKSEDPTSWEKFHLAISKEELYHEDDSNIDDLLLDMSGMEFYNISKSSIHMSQVCGFIEDFTNFFIGQKEGGTQLKLVIEFASGGLAMLKPMR